MNWTTVLASLPNWLSALGTVSACFLAIHLARRDTKSQLSGHVSLSGDGKHHQQVSVEVLNTGYRPFAVRLVHWSVGRLPRQGFLMSRIPKQLREREPTLGHGESAFFAFEIADLGAAWAVASTRRRFFRKLASTSLDVLFDLSTGERVRLHVPRQVIAALRSWLALNPHVTSAPAVLITDPLMLTMFSSLIERPTIEVEE